MPFPCSHPRASSRSQRGMALPLALFALLLLSAIGLGMMYTASSETWIDNNYAGTQRAYYAALAGLEEARDRINVGKTATSPVTPPAQLPSASGGTIYIVNSYQNSAGTVVSPEPWSASDPYFDNEYCHEFPSGYPTAAVTDPGAAIACSAAPFTGASWHGYYSGGSSAYVGSTWTSGAAVPSSSPNTATREALIFRWVRVQRKINYSTAPICANGNCASSSAAPVCWNGSHETVPGGSCAAAGLQPVYLLTALAASANGSRRMLQAEVAPSAMNLPTPAALTLPGTLPAGAPSVCGGIACSGSTPAPAFVVNGTAPAACSSGTAAPAVGVSDAASAANLCNAIGSSANYPGSATACGNSTSVANVGAANPSLASVTYLDGLVSYVTGIADSVVTSCSNPAPFGSSGHPQTVVVNGDCSMSGSSFPHQGEGVLVVTGTLTFSDNPYNGVVLVIGQGSFIQSTTSSTHFDGALLVAKTRDSGGNLLGALGTPSFSWQSPTGGPPPASAPSLQFDSCEVFRSTLLNYKTLAVRELMY